MVGAQTMPDTYRAYREIAVADGEQTVRFKLHERIDLPPGPFYTASWRTTYPGTTQNRRFYWVRDTCWTIAAVTAQRVLERAQSEGLLDAKYDDPYLRFGGGKPDFLFSASLPAVERREIWRDLTREGREPPWGANTAFAIATEAGGRWRKVMIIDSERKLATFRSCTVDASYPLRVRLPTSSRWFMDNAMQDASTAIMRFFLQCLNTRDSP
jgi:hypothetical protein